MKNECTQRTPEQFDEIIARLEETSFYLNKASVSLNRLATSLNVLSLLLFWSAVLGLVLWYFVF